MRILTLQVAIFSFKWTWNQIQDFLLESEIQNIAKIGTKPPTSYSTWVSSRKINLKITIIKQQKQRGFLTRCCVVKKCSNARCKHHTKLFPLSVTLYWHCPNDEIVSSCVRPCITQSFKDCVSNDGQWKSIPGIEIPGIMEIKRWP